MSFLSKLFGGRPKSEAATEQGKPFGSEEYNGFLLLAMPYQANGEFQLCGIIRKEIDGATREHRFVRADRFASPEAAVQPTLQKARLIVDQMGDAIFT